MSDPTSRSTAKSFDFYHRIWAEVHGSVPPPKPIVAGFFAVDSDAERGAQALGCRSAWSSRVPYVASGLNERGIGRLVLLEPLHRLRRLLVNNNQRSMFRPQVALFDNLVEMEEGRVVAGSSDTKCVIDERSAHAYAACVRRRVSALFAA
ncbi:MAG TPA: hypothetical protein VK821_15245 [Dehalococcoidia bacterium]|nr:hypothetical protein [Dehalococcoidia bacterium]